MSVTIETYGPGGFDPDAANGGVVETVTVPVPPEAVNADTLQQRTKAAMAANRTFLALSSPSAAQNAQQIKALTRQVQALIRFTLADFDGTD
jgi:hypothetical protein